MAYFPGGLEGLIPSLNPLPLFLSLPRWRSQFWRTMTRWPSTATCWLSALANAVGLLPPHRSAQRDVSVGKKNRERRGSVEGDVVQLSFISERITGLIQMGTKCQWSCVNQDEKKITYTGSQSGSPAKPQIHCVKGESYSQGPASSCLCKVADLR